MGITGCRRIFLILAMITVALALQAGCHRAPPPPPASAPRKAAETEGPFTRLYDGTLTPAGLQDRESWTALAEDDTTHVFANEALALNDKLVLAIGRGASGAALFARAGQALKPRVALAPVGEDGEMTLAGLSISENSSGAVALDCRFSSATGKSAEVTYRLTTGANLVEVRPGEGASRLRIEQPIKYVVVPDYFADDFVASAASASRSRVGLPAENCLLALAGDGEEITACVWPYGQVDADAVVERAGEKTAFQGVEIACLPGKSIWVALLQGPGIWHSRRIAAAENAETELAWRRPFAAQWRCDLVGADSSLARSMSFADGPGPGGNAPRCWFNEDRAFVRPDAAVSAEAMAEKPAGERMLLVYPIDRTPATPLTVFCVNDVMRSALGTGPCQYVLAAEGMGTNYPATPDLVSRWIEEELRKGKLKKDSAALRERLDQMARHVEEVQSWIRDYGKLADRIQSSCAEPGLSTEARPLSQEVLALLEGLRSAVGADENVRDSAEQVTREIVALAEKEGDADRWQEEMEKVCALGSAQDRSLAQCRMTLRRVIQLCRGAPEMAADFAHQVQGLAQSGLRRETPTQHEERKNGSE
jgi:hypothetical protein